MLRGTGTPQKVKAVTLVMLKPKSVRRIQRSTRFASTFRRTGLSLSLKEIVSDMMFTSRADSAFPSILGFVVAYSKYLAHCHCVYDGPIIKVESMTPAARGAQ